VNGTVIADDVSRPLVSLKDEADQGPRNLQHYMDRGESLKSSTLLYSLCCVIWVSYMTINNCTNNAFDICITSYSTVTSDNTGYRHSLTFAKHSIFSINIRVKQTLKRLSSQLFHGHVRYGDLIRKRFWVPFCHNSLHQAIPV
jgi:hypothetical protein